jgi:hypothetical protein
MERGKIGMENGMNIAVHHYCEECGKLIFKGCETHYEYPNGNWKQDMDGEVIEGGECPRCGRRLCDDCGKFDDDLCADCQTELDAEEVGYIPF